MGGDVSIGFDGLFGFGTLDNLGFFFGGGDILSRIWDVGLG